MMDATDTNPGDPITGWKPVPLSPYAAAGGAPKFSR
jgi:hypothetical protein